MRMGLANTRKFGSKYLAVRQLPHGQKSKSLEYQPKYNLHRYQALLVIGYKQYTLTSQAQSIQSQDFWAASSIKQEYGGPAPCPLRSSRDDHISATSLLYNDKYPLLFPPTYQKECWPFFLCYRTNWPLLVLSYKIN